MSEAECLALLAGHGFGRLAVTADGQPLVFPVNYILDDRTVAIRTDPGTKLDRARLGRVAFEIDSIDPVHREGWSVLVEGVGRDITDAVDAWSRGVRGDHWRRGPPARRDTGSPLRHHSSRDGGCIISEPITDKAAKSTLRRDQPHSYTLPIAPS